jgi:murein hydrolase activator
MVTGIEQMRALFKIILFIISVTILYTENCSALQTDQNKELVQIRGEIKKYEQELAQQKATEKTVLNYLSTLEHDIDLTTSHVAHLRKDIIIREQQADHYRSDIDKTNDDITRLKEQLRKRIIYIYKQGNRQDYELLLSGKSLNHLLVWLRYRKMIIDNDKRNILALREKKGQLLLQQDILNSEIQKSQRSFLTKQAEEQHLREDRQQRADYLVSVLKNKKLLEEQLREVKQAERKIMGLISQAEEKRLSEQARKSGSDAYSTEFMKRDHHFSDLKGRLRWPTMGRIVGHFGKQKHPQLNTITENLGVEIKAVLGAAVMSVDDGQVQTITWQRGRGNIIIISHDDGYYTVYTNLGEISVQLSENVSQGQVIGTVGDSNSMGQPILYFQIWKNTKNLNPEDWLS